MTESSGPKKRTEHQTLKEHYSFIIALVVIIPFMTFFGVVLLYLQNMEMLEKLTALLSGFVAAVLGYFFGQRPVQELARQVSRAEEEKEEIEGDAEDEGAKLNRLIKENRKLEKEITKGKINKDIIEELDKLLKRNE